MSRIARAAAVALGLTTICLAWLVEPLVRSSHDLVYHWEGTPAVLFGPVVLAVLLVWTVLTALLVLVAKTRGRWRVAAWAGIVLLFSWIALRNAALLWPLTVPRWVQFPPVYVAAGLWLLAVGLWRPRVAGGYERAIEFVSTILAFVAISGALFLSQLLWYWWQARALNEPLPLHHEQVAFENDPRPGPRIIWIVFDELSYQQVYERRYPGLQLPAFDALGRESAVFTDVVPEGVHTEMVLPALITGTPVNEIRPSADGQLAIHNSTSGKWMAFDQHNTVFQDALDDGYSTAVAGWFNPYCRIMPAVLDRCYWKFGDLHDNGLASNGTVRSNLLSAASVLIGNGRLHHLLWRIFSLPAETDLGQELHIEDYESLAAEADKVLADRSVGFTLIHLPVPHPQGFYDRATGQLTMGATSYIDNLALADRCLAHLRAVLEQEGQWDSSTVVVMGDHSWRTFSWKTMPKWTMEDQRASDGGKYDSRPGYIVKLAGEQTGTRIDLPFRAVKTRALIDALMTRKIRTTDDLQSWVRQSLQHP